MGMPYGFDETKRPPYADEMMRMLSSINDRHFGGKCPFGNLVHQIGYNSPACSTDYVVEHLHVPFAFSWEIYGVGNHVDQVLGSSPANAVNQIPQKDASLLLSRKKPPRRHAVLDIKSQSAEQTKDSR